MVLVLAIVALLRYDKPVVREPGREQGEQQADDARHEHGAQDVQHLDIASVQAIGPTLSTKFTAVNTSLK